MNRLFISLHRQGLSVLRFKSLMLATCALTLWGCGYAHTDRFPTDVRTVAVPLFENQSFYQGVEFDLTEALIKEIELNTPYKVTGADRADTIIDGVIVSVEQHRLSRQSIGGAPQELEMQIVINYSWKHQNSGKIIRQREGFISVGRYIPTRPIAEPLEVAQHEAVGRLASGIVSAMASDW